MEIFVFLDLLGTLIFAITGAFRAVKYELDILGVIVLATFTGIGGGIIRDIIIGRTPPGAFQDELYLMICIFGGLLVFFAAPKIAVNWPVIKIGDAIGLGVFSILGAWKALESGLGLFGTIMMGTITAVGGGVIRDLFVMEIPAVIRNDFYATAAAIGSISFFILFKIKIPLELNMIICFLLTTSIRIIAMIFKINLPRVKKLPAEPAEMSKNSIWKRFKV